MMMLVWKTVKMNKIISMKFYATMSFDYTMSRMYTVVIIGAKNWKCSQAKMYIEKFAKYDLAANVTFSTDWGTESGHR